MAPRADRRGHGETEVLQHRQEMHRQDSGDRRAQGDRQRQQDELHGRGPHPGNGSGVGTARRLRHGWADAPQPRHQGQVQRQRHGQVQRGIDEAGAAPAQAGVEPCRERPADRAGEPAEQGERGDRLPCSLAVQPPQGREGRIVEARTHGEAQDQPAGQIGRQAGRQGEARISPVANSAALAARTGRPPWRSIRRPTRGEARPAVSRPRDSPPTIQRQGPSGIRSRPPGPAPPGDSRTSPRPGSASGRAP